MSTPHDYPSVVVLVHVREGDGVTHRTYEHHRLHKRHVRQVVFSQGRHCFGELLVAIDVALVYDVVALKDHLFTSADVIANFDCLLDIWIGYIGHLFHWCFFQRSKCVPFVNVQHFLML